MISEPPLEPACQQALGFRDRHRVVTTGRGFAACRIAIYICPSCNQATHLHVNYSGGTPNGGVVCGKKLTAAAASVTLQP
jgi:hypothetical protein